MAETTRQPGKAVPGYYTIHLVRRGPTVPVLLERDKDDRWSATILGFPQPFWYHKLFSEHTRRILQARHGIDNLPWSYSSEEIEFLWVSSLLEGELSIHPFARILMHGYPTSKTEYKRLMDVYYWAVKEAPWHPLLRPTEPIDLKKLPVLGSVTVPRRVKSGSSRKATGGGA